MSAVIYLIMCVILLKNFISRLVPIFSSLMLFFNSVPLETVDQAITKQKILDASKRSLRAIAEYGKYLREQLLPVSNGNAAIGERLYGYLLGLQTSGNHNSRDLENKAKVTLATCEVRPERLMARMALLDVEFHSGKAGFD